MFHILFCNNNEIAGRRRRGGKRLLGWWGRWQRVATLKMGAISKTGVNHENKIIQFFWKWRNPSSTNFASVLTGKIELSGSKELIMVERFLFCNKYTSLYNNVIKSTAKSLHCDCPRVESLSYNCISSEERKSFLYLLLSPHSDVPSASDAKSQNFLGWEVCYDE